MTGNIFSRLKTVGKLSFPETWFLTQLPEMKMNWNRKKSTKAVNLMLTSESENHVSIPLIFLNQESRIKNYPSLKVLKKIGVVVSWCAWPHMERNDSTWRLWRKFPKINTSLYLPFLNSKLQTNNKNPETQNIWKIFWKLI